MGTVLACTVGRQRNDIHRLVSKAEAKEFWGIFPEKLAA